MINNIYYHLALISAIELLKVNRSLEMITYKIVLTLSLKMKVRCPEFSNCKV